MKDEGIVVAIKADIYKELEPLHNVEPQKFKGITPLQTETTIVTEMQDQTLKAKHAQNGYEALATTYIHLVRYTNFSYPSNLVYLCR